MQLSDKDIHKCLKNGELVLVGPNPKYAFDPVKQVQPASIDLRLDNRIVRFVHVSNSFDIKQLDNVTEFLEVEYIEQKEPIKLVPQEIVFAQVYEQMAIPNNLCARIEGRSRFARLGLSIHCTGDFINPGFVGAMPLQIVNHNSFEVTIYPYISICQLMLYRLTSEPLVPYSERSSLPYNKYQGEKYASASIMHLDEAINDEFKKKTILEEKIRILIHNYLNNMNNDFKEMRLRGLEPSQVSLKIFENIKELTSKPQVILTREVTMGNKTIGRDNIEISGNAQVTEFTTGAGDTFQGDYAQKLLQSTTPQSSQEDIVKLLSFVQQELPKLPLSEEGKEEVANEVKGAEIQAKKTPPDKPKLVDKLKNAAAALKGAGQLGTEAVAVGNLIGKAIEWGGEKWIEWMT